MGTVNGCCCGVFLGIILAVVLSAAAAFGIWCYVDPEAKSETVEFFDRHWQNVKDSGDEVVSEMKEAK